MVVDIIRHYIINKEIILSSGIHSNKYVDIRSILGNPKDRDYLVDAIAIGVQNISAVIGVSTGGIAWAALVADRLGIATGYVRSSIKGHGLERIVEGIKQEEHKILLIDDVITTGKSIDNAASYLDNVVKFGIFSWGLREDIAALVYADEL